MANLKILWLDDDFAKKEDFPSIKEKSTYKAFESRVKHIKNEIKDFGIDSVCDFESFKDKLKENRKEYWAVVLDMNLPDEDGVVKDQSRDITRFLSEKYPSLPKYIYSNTAKDENTFSFLDYAHRGRYFDKEDYEEFVSTLNKDYKSETRYYYNHDYILDFFSEGWLNSDLKSQFMNPLMKMYCEQDHETAHGNFMRNIVEGMLYRVNDEMGGKLTDKKIKDKGIIKSMIDAIVGGKITHTDFIAGPLSYISHIMNEESHNALPETDKKKFFEVDFGAFFLICEWFHKFMTQCKHDGSSNTTQQNKNKDDRPRVRSHQELHTGNSVPVDAFWDTDDNLYLYFEANSVKKYLDGNQPKRVYFDSLSIQAKGGSPYLSYWVNKERTKEELDK